MAYDLLKGKKGIIFGALDQKSIAWKVAEKVHEEGGTFTLTNAPIALRMGAINELAEKTGSTVIGADASNVEDIENLIEQSIEILGGKLDFILHCIGMSPNVRKQRAYTDLNYDFYLKTIDISALSLHKTLQTCYKKDALNDCASVLTLSYIAAQRILPGYSDMAEAKSTLESIVRSFGYMYGNKNGTRINSVSQSPTMTTAGEGVKGLHKFYYYADDVAPLGNAPAETCADYCVTLFSDLTKMVTMQNLFHDGGFSNMGMNPKILS